MQPKTKPLTHKQLVKKLKKQLEDTYHEFEIEDLLNALAAVLRQQMKQRRSVWLKGIGTMNVRDYTKTWINPKSKVASVIDYSNLTFRASKEMKEALRGEDEKHKFIDYSKKSSVKPHVEDEP